MRKFNTRPHPSAFGISPPRQGGENLLISRSRLFYLFLLLLILPAFTLQAQDKQYLKWGNYQWQVSYKFDTVDLMTISSEPGLKGEWVETKEKSKAVDPNLKFADAQKREFDLRITLTDTVHQLNPITLEETILLGSYSKLRYNIYGGKISLSAFEQLTEQPVVFPLMPHVIPGSSTIDCYSPGLRRLGSFKLGLNNKAVVGKMRSGDCALVYFEYLVGNNPHNIGRVLFEIN